MRLSKAIIKRRIPIIIIWTVIIMALTPAVLGSSHYINYSNQTSASGSSESALAQRILSSYSSNNSSLIIVIQESNFLEISNNSTASKVIAFQQSLEGSGISNYSHSTSAYTEYANFINKTLSDGITKFIKSIYHSVSQNSSNIFSFPSIFYNKWSGYGFNNSSIYKAAKAAGYNSGNSYESNFINGINKTAGSPVQRIQEAIQQSVVPNPINESIIRHISIFNYTLKYNIASVTAIFISNVSKFPLTPQYVISVISSSNPGLYYIQHFGLYGVPSFINSTYDASNITLVYVYFNTPSGKDISGTQTASELAFPKISSIASKDFSNSIVTGSGAVAYETNQQTSKSGFVFGLLFIFLAIAILFAIWSWKSAILVFIFSGVSLLLGMVSEFIAGLIFHSVSFIVNYTLEAVLLGISADYLLFIISRYRDELREGKGTEEAIETATRESGRSIFISGLTVAFSLLTFYFIPGFQDWGVTLFFAVVFTVLLETILLPPVASLFGKKLFIKSKMTPIDENKRRSSFFYRISDKSVRRRYLVIGVVLVLGTSAAFGFFNLPTTYNFDTGLSKDLPAVNGLDLIQKDFGGSQIYPVYVLFNLSSPYASNMTLKSIASELISQSGIEKGYGPYLDGTNISADSNYSKYIVDHHYALYTLYLSSSPYSSGAIQTVKDIRQNKELIVGGLTSSIIDQQNQNNRIYSELELLIVVVIGIIIGVSFKTWKYPFVS